MLNLDILSQVSRMAKRTKKSGHAIDCMVVDFGDAATADVQGVHEVARLATHSGAQNILVRFFDVDAEKPVDVPEPTE